MCSFLTSSGSYESFSLFKNKNRSQFHARKECVTELKVTLSKPPWISRAMSPGSLRVQEADAKKVITERRSAYSSAEHL